MKELRQILNNMQVLYPRSRLSDAVKLIYQNEFGCDPLLAEFGETPDALAQACRHGRRGSKLFDKIGNGFYRIHLKNAWELGADARTLLAMSKATAQKSYGNAERFSQKLDCLAQLCRERALPFSHGSCELYLLNYRAAGCPPVRHSAAYTASYTPSYRIISSEYARFFEIFLRIDRMLRTEQSPVLIAIDGPCGSGKTTLAALLAACYDCSVFHADDFYLRPGQRTPERFNQAGGNMDRERLEEEVLRPLSKGETVSYRPYSHKIRQILPGTEVPFRRVNIIEGSYSMHPDLCGYYQIKVALNISPAHQMSRLKRRESQKSLEMFRDRWIPLEQAYISATSLFENADLVYEI